MKEFAKGFYDGKAWEECRRSFIAKRMRIDGGMCEQCHEQLGYIVHHKIELNELNISNPEVSLNHDNLQFVCLECHNNIHGVGKNGARCFFDENGNPVEKIY